MRKQKRNRWRVMQKWFLASYAVNEGRLCNPTVHLLCSIECAGLSQAGESGLSNLHRRSHDGKSHSILNLSKSGLPVLALAFLQWDRSGRWAAWKLITSLPRLHVQPQQLTDPLLCADCRRCVTSSKMLLGWGKDWSHGVTPQGSSWS